MWRRIFKGILDGVGKYDDKTMYISKRWLSVIRMLKCIMFEMFENKICITKKI